MENTEQQEKNRLAQSKRLENRYYVSLFIFISIAAILAAFSLIQIVRRDDKATQGYMKCVVTAFAADGPNVTQAVNECKF